MTVSKVELATRLLKLCGDTTTDPQQLANVMSVRKLHYEIQKAEEEMAEIEEQEKVKEKVKKPKSFWAFLTMESDEEDS
jgi:hypothetical protein